MRVLSFLTLLVPLLEAIPHSLGNPTSAKHATRRSILTFSFQENDEYAGACRWKKMHSKQNLVLPNTVHSQESEQLYFSINTVLLVNTQSSYRPCILFRNTRKREAVQTHTLVVFCRIRWVNGWKNAAGAHSVRLLVDFSVYEFRSFGSLKPRP